MEQKKRLAVVTSTRAEYGLLRPVIFRLLKSERLQPLVIVTGAHLAPEYGCTVKEIEADGVPIGERIPILKFGAGRTATAQTVAYTIGKFARWFEENRPDGVLLLGDRYEIFAVAAAAAMQKIPIAHISGGDVTQGAADDYYRHCITKMASLHFPSCADSAARLLRLGEPPETVHLVGGLGDENIRTLPKLSREELCESTGFDLHGAFGLVTYHPETAGEGAAQPGQQADALLAAMNATPGIFWLMTGSNADEGGMLCTEKMRNYAKTHPESSGFVQSLGLKRYLSAMALAAVVVGNSSSGVVETPTFGVPTVNIGSRQAGRAICPNVICCGAAQEDIRKAIQRALTPEFATAAHKTVSPYYGGDTSGKIVGILEQALYSPDWGKAKEFYDGKD